MFANQKTAAVAALALAASTLPAAAQTIDERVNEIFANSTGWFVSFIFSPFPGTSFPWIVAWLVVAATIFTLYFGFIQFRAFPHSISLVKVVLVLPNSNPPGRRRRSARIYQYSVFLAGQYLVHIVFRCNRCQKAFAIRPGPRALLYHRFSQY